MAVPVVYIEAGVREATVKILITAGGSREAMDDVRYLGNRSTGRTGALIAAEAVRRFHTVYLLKGEGSISPAPWADDTGLLQQVTYTSATDLLEKGLELMGRHTFDAIIAAAAVADFAPERQKGKVSSNRDEWTLVLRPTPKVIDRLAASAPQATLVIFKLEATQEQHQLVVRAQATMNRVGADLAVANFAAGMGRDDHPALLVEPDGSTRSVEHRDHLALSLVQWLEERTQL